MTERKKDGFARVSFLIGFSILLGLNQALIKLVNAGFSPLFQSGLRLSAPFLLSCSSL